MTSIPGMTVRHSSATNSHYTPRDIIEAARLTMGSIDLDPASCAKANAVVEAARYFNADRNGFTRQWDGNVYCNPPGSKCDRDGVSVVRVCSLCDMPKCDHKKAPRVWRCVDDTKCSHAHPDVQSSQKAWWLKLRDEWMAGRVEQAIFVGFSLEILQVAQSVLNYPICVPSKRIAYFHESDSGELVEGTAPPHASVLVFLPPHHHYEADPAIARFHEAFAGFGKVVSAHYSRLTAWAEREAARERDLGTMPLFGDAL